MTVLEGYVDEQSQAIVEIGVGGRRGAITLNAIVDTGFSGDVSLPTSIAVQLGLELWGSEVFELADGSRVEGLVFVGRLHLGNEEREAEIVLSDSQEALVGTGLLRGRRLEIDFQSRRITIGAEGGEVGRGV